MAKVWVVSKGLEVVGWQRFEWVPKVWKFLDGKALGGFQRFGSSSESSKPLEVLILEVLKFYNEGTRRLLEFPP